MKYYLILLLGAICLCFLSSLQVCAKEKENIQTIKKIFALASHCANAHNTQMWRIKINSNGKATLYIDKNRLLPEVDPANKEALVTMGTFIQNVIYSAQIYNFKTKVEICGKSNFDEKIATFHFIKNNNKRINEFSKKEILLRHTDKNLFSRKQIDKKTLEQLISLDENNIKYFPLNSNQGKYLQTSLIEANKIQAFDDKKQTELSKWMRISWKENLLHSDGITPRMLGLPLPIRVFTYTCFNKNIVMSNSFRTSGVEKIKKQVNNAAGFFVITSNNSSTQDLIESGKLLQTFWITGNNNGLSIHPMSQVLEEKPFMEEINSQLGMDKPISMVLRVGYPIKSSKPTSKRRNVNQFIE